MPCASIVTGNDRTFVVVGDVMVDVFASVDGTVRLGMDQSARMFRSVGGQAANTATWLARMSDDVRLVAACGSDDEADWVRSHLADHGVRAELQITEAPTGTCVVLVDHGGRRTMLSDPAANMHLVDLPQDSWAAIFHRIAPSRRVHLHLSGYLLDRHRSLIGSLVTVARRNFDSCTVSIDTGAMAVTDTARLALASALPAVDLLIGTIDELGDFLPPASAKDRTVDSVLDAWRATYGSGTTVVVKQGHAGATADDGHERVHRPAAPVVVVDTTGAGDAFTSGFLAAWTPGRDTLAQALDSGTGVAALAVARLGAGPPSREGR